MNKNFPFNTVTRKNKTNHPNAPYQNKVGIQDGAKIIIRPNKSCNITRKAPTIPEKQ